MLFNSFGYLFFMIMVFTAYWLCPHRFRWVLLLGFSCGFYYRSVLIPQLKDKKVFQYEQAFSVNHDVSRWDTERWVKEWNGSNKGCNAGEIKSR